MKKQNKIYLGIFLALVLVIGLYILAQPQTISVTNADETTTTLQKCNWFCSLFQSKQQAYFLQGGAYPTYYTVGDVVPLKEELLISSDTCATRGVLTSLYQVIYKDGSIYQTVPAMYTDTSTVPMSCPTSYTLIKSTTFTPQLTGIYTVKTFVKRQKDTSYTTIDCTGTTSQCNLDIRAKSTTDVCPLSPKWGNWLDVPIPNGIEQVRTYFSVTGTTSQCTLQQTSTQQTQIKSCNSGYVSDGTNCVVKAVSTPETTLVTCSNGTQATKQSDCPYVICSDGSQVASVDLCPTLIPDTTIPADQTIPANNETSSGSEVLPAKTIPWQTILLWFGVGVVVILVWFITYKLVNKKR